MPENWREPSPELARILTKIDALSPQWKRENGQLCATLSNGAHLTMRDRFLSGNSASRPSSWYEIEISLDGQKVVSHVARDTFGDYEYCRNWHKRSTAALVKQEEDEQDEAKKKELDVKNRFWNS